MQPLLLEGVAKQLMRVRKWEQGGNPEQDKARAEAGGHACLVPTIRCVQTQTMGSSSPRTFSPQGRERQLKDDESEEDAGAEGHALQCFLAHARDCLLSTEYLEFSLKVQIGLATREIG